MTKHRCEPEQVLSLSATDVAEGTTAELLGWDMAVRGLGFGQYYIHCAIALLSEGRDRPPVPENVQ